MIHWQIVHESESRIKRIKLLFAIVTSVLFILSICLVLFLPAITNHNPDKSIRQNDSTEYYLKLVKDIRQELKERAETANVYYFIKKEDNLSEIANLFYNDGSRTKQIITDNNLQKGYNLLSGQSLIIKIKSRKGLIK